MPITFAWRDELEKKASNAINRALGQPPPSRGSVLSRGGARSVNQFDHTEDDRVRLLFDCVLYSACKAHACKK